MGKVLWLFCTMGKVLWLFVPREFFYSLEIVFFTQKTSPKYKKKYILLLIKTRFSICNDKIIVLHFVQTLLAFGPFFGIFWPSRGLTASLRPKNPSKRASGQNSLDAVQKIFCHCSCKICSLLRIKIYHFIASTA